MRCSTLQVTNGCVVTRTITYTAEGLCKTNICRQSYVWTVDTTAPVFTKFPANRILGCNPSLDLINAATNNCDTATNNVFATDDCGVIPTITCAQVDATNGCAVTRTITYTATGGCGNTASKTQTISWTHESSPPVFTLCPVPTLDLGCNPVNVPECDATVAATANCGLTPARQDLLVSSPGDNTVKHYDGTTGGFLGTLATVPLGLTTPAGVVMGSDGNVYVSSVGNNAVRRYNPTTGAFVSTFVTVGSGGLSAPDGLVFGPNNGDLYISSTGDNTVKRYNGSSGAFITNFVLAASGGLSTPAGLVFGPDGNLYVSSAGDNTVKRYNGTTGAFINNFVAAASGGLSTPAGLAFGPDGHLYVSSTGDNTVKRYNGATGAFIDNFVAADSGGLGAPAGLVFGPDNNLYVSSGSNAEVLRYNGATGAFIDIFVTSGSGGLSGRSWVVFTPALPFSQQLKVTCAKVDSSDGCVHTRVLTYTAVDACNNTNTCAQVITWKVDTDAPTFTVCPANINLGSNPAVIPDCDTSSGNVLATDTCPVLPLTCAKVDTVNGCVHTRTITYTATDVCGNTNTCTQLITWTDQAVVPPPLGVVLQGTNVVISWPIACGTFELQQTADLTPPSTWSPAGGTVVDVGGMHTVTLPVGGGHTFFRLKYP